MISLMCNFVYFLVQRRSSVKQQSNLQLYLFNLIPTIIFLWRLYHGRYGGGDDTNQTYNGIY